MLESIERFGILVPARTPVDVIANLNRAIGEALQTGRQVSEYEVQQFIRTAFAEAGLFTDHGPIVGVNANASNPHYETSAQAALLSRRFRPDRYVGEA